jgi:polyisoprenyl-phosphate glycosyltransferase
MSAVAAQQDPSISLVTPAYNEAGNLAQLYDRLSLVMDSTGLTWEWVVIDDHSSDETFTLLSQLAARDTRVRGVRLTRNFGSHAAILCGLASVRGAAAIVLAGDGQDPPEEIPRLIAAWREGRPIVWAEKTSSRSPAWAGRMASGTFNRLMRRWSGLDNLAKGGSDFFLVERPVIDVINTLGERNTNVMALLAWVGFDQATISYDKMPREHGASGWTVTKKVKLLLDSVLGFSVRPIQAMTVVGFLTAVLGFVYAAIVAARAIFDRPVEGWSSLIFVVLILGGVQMVMLGVLGEYLWRALDEIRGRPRYIVEQRIEQRASVATAVPDQPTRST